MSSVSATRRVLAVMAVTTALCADQAAVGAQSARIERPEISQIASRFVNQLARRLGRVPAVALQREAAHRTAAGDQIVCLPRETVVHFGAVLSVVQFRMPPPVC